MLADSRAITAARSDPAITEAAEEAAWRAWRFGRSAEARERLVRRHVHLVRYMAHRLSRTVPLSVELDDLIGAGAIGLLEALDTFDPARAARFTSFALTRIRGAMLDFLRALDPLGRARRGQLRRARAAAAALARELGRAPTESEVAAEIGLDLGTYRALVATAAASAPVSLDLPDDTRDDDPDDARKPLGARVADPTAPDPLEHAETRQAAARLRARVAELPPGHQLILHLHYVEELNFREIAMVLDVSESRTIQLHAQALRALARRLPPADAAAAPDATHHDATPGRTAHRCQESGGHVRP